MCDDDKTKGDKKMSTVIQRPCSPIESIKRSCKEMKLIKEGKLSKKTWEQFLDELKKEDTNKD